MHELIKTYQPLLLWMKALLSLIDSLIIRSPVSSHISACQFPVSPDPRWPKNVTSSWWWLAQPTSHPMSGIQIHIEFLQENTWLFEGQTSWISFRICGLSKTLKPVNWKFSNHLRWNIQIRNPFRFFLIFFDPEVDIMVWKLSWFMPRWDLMVIPCPIYGRNHVKGGCEQTIGRPAKVQKSGKLTWWLWVIFGEFFLRNRRYQG